MTLIRNLFSGNTFHKPLMPATGLLTVFFLICGSISGQNSITNKTKPEVGLTLIPPSPITEEVTLEIRAGIRNESNMPKNFHVFFYLDEEKKRNSLHHAEVLVNPRSSKGISFRWPAKNKTGPHKILLVCHNGKRLFRTEQGIRVIASD